MTRVVTALLVVVVTLTACRGVEAFSLGRLFPASRRGVRGTLLSSFANSKVSSSSLKDAMKQAIVKTNPSKHTSSIRPETVKQDVKQEAYKENMDAKDKVKPQIYKTPQTPRTPLTATTTTQAPTTTTVTTTQTPPPIPLTDSPIYYIRLPPRPYVYMPGLGYVSPNRNHFSFLRPNVNFVNNGKPSSVFHFKAPSTPAHHIPPPTAATPPTTTTTTTTTTTPPPTTTTSPTTTKKPSLITWLTGPWFFNGSPSNLFIYRSPYNPSHLDKLHQTYKKPGVYVK